MTVELAHPSTEPLGSGSPIEPAHPRWWFVATTPGRILSIGLVLAILGGLSAFATSTTINQRQHALTTVLSHTEPLAFAAGRIAGVEPDQPGEELSRALTAVGHYSSS